MKKSFFKKRQKLSLAKADDDLDDGKLSSEKRLLRCLKKLHELESGNEEAVAERTKELELEVSGLKEAEHAKNEFIRITNHELRTPLDVIRGNLDMVLKGDVGSVSVQIKEYLSDALLGSDRLTKLINDMLDISRIETSRMKFVLEEIDLDNFLKTIIVEFRHLAQEKHLNLYLNASPRLSHVFSDRSKIFQIIDNLLGNALKFTPAGGSITISAKIEGEMASVSVRDTGIGIRQEDKEKLFKQFPQIDAGITGVAKGTGLGLNLVWRLVEKLGGDVRAESAGLGKGSVFSFRLPVAGTKRAEELARFHNLFLNS